MQIVKRNSTLKKRTCLPWGSTSRSCTLSPARMIYEFDCQRPPTRQIGEKVTKGNDWPRRLNVSGRNITSIHNTKGITGPDDINWVCRHAPAFSH
ncbi:hypothetical protein GBA52_015648 [Prunus armeniaca]|nr:hypothetical protein GBA52_015648 [Prunus armeniaca]